MRKFSNKTNKSKTGDSSSVSLDDAKSLQMQAQTSPQFVGEIKTRFLGQLTRAICFEKILVEKIGVDGENVKDCGDRQLMVFVLRFHMQTSK
jgi:hypothetical protein